MLCGQDRLWAARGVKAYRSKVGATTAGGVSKEVACPFGAAEPRCKKRTASSTDPASLSLSLPKRSPQPIGRRPRTSEIEFALSSWRRHEPSAGSSPVLDRSQVGGVQTVRPVKQQSIRAGLNLRHYLCALGLLGRARLKWLALLRAPVARYGACFAGMALAVEARPRLCRRAAASGQA